MRGGGAGVRGVRGLGGAGLREPGLPRPLQEEGGGEQAGHGPDFTSIAGKC